MVNNSHFFVFIIGAIGTFVAMDADVSEWIRILMTFVLVMGIVLSIIFDKNLENEDKEDDYDDEDNEDLL